MEITESGTFSPVYDKQTFGAAVVSRTIDTMNSNQFLHKNNTLYDFQKDVLMPAYTGESSALLDQMV